MENCERCIAREAAGRPACCLQGAAEISLTRLASWLRLESNPHWWARGCRGLSPPPPRRTTRCCMRRSAGAGRNFSTSACASVCECVTDRDVSPKLADVLSEIIGTPTPTPAPALRKPAAPARFWFPTTMSGTLLPGGRLQCEVKSCQA